MSYLSSKPGGGALTGEPTEVVYFGADGNPTSDENFRRNPISKDTYIEKSLTEVTGIDVTFYPLQLITDTGTGTFEVGQEITNGTATADITVAFYDDEGGLWFIACENVSGTFNVSDTVTTATGSAEVQFIPVPAFTVSEELLILDSGFNPFACEVTAIDGGTYTLGNIGGTPPDVFVIYDPVGELPYIVNTSDIITVDNGNILNRITGSQIQRGFVNGDFSQTFIEHWTPTEYRLEKDGAGISFDSNRYLIRKDRSNLITGTNSRAELYLDGNSYSGLTVRPGNSSETYGYVSRLSGVQGGSSGVEGNIVDTIWNPYEDITNQHLAYDDEFRWTAMTDSGTTTLTKFEINKGDFLVEYRDPDTDNTTHQIRFQQRLFMSSYDWDTASYTGEMSFPLPSQCKDMPSGSLLAWNGANEFQIKDDFEMFIEFPVGATEIEFLSPRKFKISDVLPTNSATVGITVNNATYVIDDTIDVNDTIKITVDVTSKVTLRCALVQGAGMPGRATDFWYLAPPQTAFGLYTPVEDSTVNVSTIVWQQAMWTRIGDIVRVSGQVVIEPTSNNTQTEVFFDLPVPSDLDIVSRLTGRMIETTGAAHGVNGSLIADTTDNLAHLIYHCDGLSSSTLQYDFTYQVLPEPPEE